MTRRRASLIQWLVLAGIWAPVCAELLAVALMAWIGRSNSIPPRWMGLPFLAFTIAVVSAHAFLPLSAIGAALVARGQATQPRMVVLSVALALCFAVPVLCTVWFDVGLLSGRHP